MFESWRSGELEKSAAKASALRIQPHNALKRLNTRYVMALEDSERG